jgi:hypothetical protein
MTMMPNRTGGANFVQMIREIVTNVLSTAKHDAMPPFKIATIPAAYTSGRPTLIWDGETTASARTYPYVASYTPAANDRVIVAMCGQVPVIFGKIV